MNKLSKAQQAAIIKIAQTADNSDIRQQTIIALINKCYINGASKLTVHGCKAAQELGVTPIEAAIMKRPSQTIINRSNPKKVVRRAPSQEKKKYHLRDAIVRVALGNLDQAERLINDAMMNLLPEFQAADLQVGFSDRLQMFATASITALQAAKANCYIAAQKAQAEAANGTNRILTPGEVEQAAQKAIDFIQGRYLNK